MRVEIMHVPADEWVDRDVWKVRVIKGNRTYQTNATWYYCEEAPAIRKRDALMGTK